MSVHVYFYTWLRPLKPNLDKSISVHAEFFLHLTSLFYWSKELWPHLYLKQNGLHSKGCVGSCNHQHRRDEVFGVEENVVACHPVGHCVPAYLPKGWTLH